MKTADYTDSSSQVGEFEWSDRTVALVLGAFFYGYTATNFLGGRAAEYFGGRLTFGLGVVVPAILSLLSPLCIHTSENLFIALRVLEGMTQVKCTRLCNSAHFDIPSYYHSSHLQ